jgi:serine/threonine protein kinase
MSPPLPPAVDTDREHGKRVFRIGSYRLAEKLGEGAMGTVYRAVHVESGARVAIKTARNTRQSAVASIRREIEILEQLDHPGIVRLLDEGTSRGIPWFAMELLEGATFHEVLAEKTAAFDSQLELGAPGTQSEQGRGHLALFDGPGPRSSRHKPSARQAGPDDQSGARPSWPNVRFQPEHVHPLLLILSRLCRTLSYLHNEGVIHRDLKPSNVFLRDGDAPVLVDFGVVGWFEGSKGRERLMGIDRRRFAGTLQYMAPEQIRGELVDARADLYAVGCMLYAAVAGVQPFSARTPQEVIQRHMDASYTSAALLVEGVPAELVALIDKLLAPDPGQRIGHADVVARSLEHLVRGVPVSQTEGGASSKVRSIHLNKPGFVGRQALFEQIKHEMLAPTDDVARATTRPLVFMIGGHSGSGKTRLAMELGAAAENAGVRVTTECADASLAEPRHRVHAEPLGMFRSTLQAIADHCREHGAEETSRVVGRRAAVLAQYESSLAGLPGREGQTRPVELPSRAARVRTFTYLTETLAAFAKTRSVLIIIDDLHLADELSLGFLDSLLRTGGLEQVVILATYGLEEHAEMASLLTHSQASAFELAALESEDIGSLVGGMLAMDDPPEDFVERLGTLSMGNPFAVSEYVHAAVEQGLLVRSEDGAWQVDAGLLETDGPDELLAPSSRLASVIEGRLDRLERVERQLVEFAAVSTRRLDPELLGDLAGLSRQELDTAVRRLCVRRIFEEKDGRMRLVEQVRRVAYDRLEKNQCRMLHRKLARALERRGGGTLDVLHLLEQWRGAGVGSREICYVERAAENALVRGTPSTARSLLQRGLRLVNQLQDGRSNNRADDKYGALELRRARLERLLAKVHWSSGEVDLTITLLQRSLAHLGFELPESNSQWYARAALEVVRQLRNMIWPAMLTPKDAKDAERLEQGLESGLSLLWPTILRGDIDQAMMLAAMLANMSDRLGSEQHYALPFALIAGLCHQLDLGSLTSFYETRARENLDQSQSITDFVGTMRIFMYWRAARGDWGRVDRLLREALDFCEGAGDQIGHESLLITGAVLQLSRDGLDEARHLLRRTEEITQLGGSEMRGAWSRVVHAMIARQEGDAEQSLEWIDGQVERFDKMSERTGLGYALTVSAVSHCEAGLVREGFRLAEEALETFELLSGGGDRNVILYYMYEWLPSAFLCCWQAEALDDAERARALAHIRHLTDRLETFAGYVEVARAAWLRNKGLLTAIDGDTAAGSELLSQSLTEAKRLGLSYQDRLTRQVAARLGEYQS